MSDAALENDAAADFTAFMELLWPGPLLVQAVSTAARLELADHLAEAAQATERLAASASVEPHALGRLLQALSSAGLFRRGGDGRWRNTPLSELLREDHPRSVRSWALTIGAPFFWRPMSELHRSIATGKEAFSGVFEASFFDYLKANPEQGRLFNEAMAAQSTGLLGALPDAYDFSRFHGVADLGGGTGTVLASLLRANPGLEGLLLELPEVIDAVEPSLMAELGDRLTLQSGDLLERVPEGPDCYIMVRVIHDWPDAEAVRILRNVRRAMKPGGTLLLVDNVLDENAPPSHAMMDMLMLVLVGSMERTEGQFAALLHEAGFELAEIIRHGRLTMLECRPASID